MRSEIDRPPVPETPDMFSKIEANLMQEAARIRARHVARQRRTRWYHNMGPALTAGAAFAALALMFPLTLDGPGQTQAPAVELAPVADPGVADPSVATVVHLRRLPVEDRTAMEGTTEGSETEIEETDDVEDTSEPGIQNRVS